MAFGVQLHSGCGGSNNLQVLETNLLRFSSTMLSDFLRGYFFLPLGGLVQKVGGPFAECNALEGFFPSHTFFPRH